MIGKVCIGLVVGLAVGIFVGGLMTPGQTSAQPPPMSQMDARGARIVTGEQMIALTQRGPSGDATFAVLDPDSKTVTVFSSSSPGATFVPWGAPLRYGPERPAQPAAAK